MKLTGEFSLYQIIPPTNVNHQQALTNKRELMEQHFIKKTLFTLSETIKSFGQPQKKKHHVYVEIILSSHARRWTTEKGLSLVFLACLMPKTFEGLWELSGHDVHVRTGLTFWESKPTSFRGAERRILCVLSSVSRIKCLQVAILQTTHRSEVDTCTKRVISGSPLNVY